MVPRTLRADAERNRAALLDAAHRVFSDPSGQPSMEAVARAAGVGIGTLYRHFPSRESLLEALHADELTRVCATAPELLQARTAAAALRLWFDRYADFVGTKRGMADALRAAIDSGEAARERTRAELRGAVDVLLRAGAEDGTLRTDVRAEDVVAGLAALVLTTPREQRDQVNRLLDVFVVGLSR